MDADKRNGKRRMKQYEIRAYETYITEEEADLHKLEIDRSWPWEFTSVFGQFYFLSSCFELVDREESTPIITDFDDLAELVRALKRRGVTIDDVHLNDSKVIKTDYWIDEAWLIRGLIEEEVWDVEHYFDPINTNGNRD